MARAFLASQLRPSARLLRWCSEEELDELLVRMLELPTLDTSMLLPLPRLLTPDVERLLAAVERGDLDEIDDCLPDVLNRVDTPRARATLASALLALRDRPGSSPTSPPVGSSSLPHRRCDGWSARRSCNRQRWCSARSPPPLGCCWRDRSSGSRCPLVEQVVLGILGQAFRRRQCWVVHAAQPLSRTLSVFTTKYSGRTSRRIGHRSGRIT